MYAKEVIGDNYEFSVNLNGPELPREVFLFKSNEFLLRTENEPDCLQSDSKNPQSKSVKRMRHVELSNQLPRP